ncbi:MAG: tripartite tricarboxylate transporter TctB family protein [Eubacteriales bacterium]|nr:tripartite tricarboxylate transporter TctB family protein [Eubacteriales bacterium]
MSYLLSFIIEIIGILTGLFYVIMGVTKYGLWAGITINGGFMPAVCGGLVSILCVLQIITKIKKGVKPDTFDPKAMVPVAAMVLILVCNALIGLLPACMAIAFLWIKFIEKYSWKTSLVVTVILYLATYGIFKLWLNVPFPTGLIGELL